ncbi:MAG TPA: DUF2231 domain-containing protein [Methylomirabilota bacterium]|nr:DUF2231 domain-containing protein [Methylomirabilota bacterium]
MDWVHLHLALNHIPVVGIPFAILVVICGWVRPRREVFMLGLWLTAITSAAAIAIKFTGDEAAAVLNKTADPFVAQHEQSADQATTAVFFLLIASVAALFLGRKGRRVPKMVLVTWLIIGAATCVMLARTANLGGQIVHSEIR